VIPFLCYNARVSAAAMFGTDSILPEQPKPFLATVNLTENCQAHCITCNYWQSSKRNPITTERAIELLRELDDCGFRYLRFLGGEPLLRKDLFEILAHVRESAFGRVVLATNGLLLGRFAEPVNQSAITNTTVSVDGVGDTCDLMRGTPGYFDKVMKGLTRIYGKRVKLASIATKYLAKDIDNLLAICKDRGYDFDICLPSRLLPFADTEEIAERLQELWPSVRETDQILAAVREHGLASESVLEGARDYLVHGDFPYRKCVLGYTEIIIRANGDVHPGCYELGPTGSILRSSLQDVLSSEGTAVMTRDMFNLKCSGCLIGWQTSRAFERPIGNLAYVRRRLRGLRTTDR